MSEFLLLFFRAVAQFINGALGEDAPDLFKNTLAVGELILGGLVVAPLRGTSSAEAP